MRPNRHVSTRRLRAFSALLTVAALSLSSLTHRTQAQATWNYVAMGDSLAFGLWALPGSSYVSRYRNYVQTDYSVTANLNNLGVNGWRSIDLLNAVLTNSSFRTAIMNAQVITWDIGGNDLLDARSSYKSGSCGGGDNQNCLRNTLSTIKANWDTIMREILLLRGTNVIVRTFPEAQIRLL